MRFTLALALPLSLAVSAVSAVSIPDAPRYEDLATAVVSDIQATMSVVKADQSELRKISKDFGMAYRLKSVTLRFKRPGKLRMEGRIGQEPALYIVNGSTRYYSVPRLKLAKKDDLGDSPGKRYSLLELGIVSRGDLAAIQPKYLRTEALDGVNTPVFEVGYKGDESFKYILWIDPRTHVILRRDWLDSAGKLRATFLHHDPKEIAPGVWLASRLEIRTGDGTTAAITEYTDVKVNQNLSDSLFDISQPPNLPPEFSRSGSIGLKRVARSPEYCLPTFGLPPIKRVAPVSLLDSIRIVRSVDSVVTLISAPHSPEADVLQQHARHLIFDKAKKSFS